MQLLRTIGSAGSGDGQFDLPGMLDIYDGEVFVTDYGLHRVQVFSLNGTFLRKWGSFGSADTQFDRPVGIRVYNDEVYVCDVRTTSPRYIKVFDLNGNFLRKWSAPTVRHAMYYLDVYEDEVYTSITTSHYIRVFNLTGTSLRSWGSYGSGNGQMEYPRGISCHEGEVYVSDQSNNRVQVFSKTGTYARKWTATDLNDPMGIHAAADGKVYAVNWASPAGAWIFESDGTLKQRWTSWSGGFFVLPRDIQVYDKQVYVLESSCVRVFGLPAAGLCLMRSHQGRRLLFLVNSDGKLEVRRYDEGSPVTILVDANSGCSYPAFDLHGHLVEGTYLRDGTGKLARSFNEGGSWTVVDVPGGPYESQSSVFHRGRRVFCGYRNSQWYVRVGVLGTDLSYTWGAEVSMGLTTPGKEGSLRTDGTLLEFAYLDTAGSAHVAQCYSLANNGTGAWI